MVKIVDKSIVYKFLYDNDDLRDYEKDFILSNRDALSDMLLNTAYYREYPIVFAYTVDNNPLAIWGANVFWEGVCETYAFFTNKAVNEYKVTVSREAKKYMEYLHRLGFRRIQATVQMSNPTSLKWHKWLGFKEEGIMRKYGIDGDDYIMMSRIQ